MQYLLLLFTISIGVIISASIAARIRYAKIAIGLMAFACSIGLSADTRLYVGTWIRPLQEYRSELFFSGGLVLSLGLLIHISKLRLSDITTQGWFLLVITLYQGFLRLYHDTFFLGLSTIGGTLVTLLPLLVVVPALIREDRADWVGVIRLLAWTQVIWLLFVLIQFALNFSQMTAGWHNRFVGLTGNPQAAAVLLSITAVVFLWLIFNDPLTRYRWLWIVCCGASVLLLVGSGSRTGGLMVVTGAMICSYRRIGQSVLLFPLVGIAAWLTLQLLKASAFDLGYERFTSLENTRTEAWLGLLEQGMENPIFGQGFLGTEFSENSYLLAFAAFGIGCLFLVTAFTIYSFFLCLKLWRLSWSRPNIRPFVDFTLAVNAMYFGGAMLEGIILSRAAPALIVMAITTGITHAILHETESDHDELEEYDVSDDDSEYNPDRPEGETVIA